MHLCLKKFFKKNCFTFFQVQLKHLIEHLNELCKDTCMQQACKGSTDVEFYVKGKAYTERS